MQPPSNQVDEESKKFLLDVKKGKARKFVMIKEGVNIDRLYIFKKGPYDRYVRMAKQEGVRGEAFWGVLRGDGVDVHFELSRTDGFESPPGTNIRLKEFLKEATGLKFEPDYVIVDALTPIEETDQESGIGAPTDGEEGARVEKDRAEDAEEKFIRLLKLILPHVKRALATTTSVSDDLQARVREAQDLGRRRDFEQGLAVLRKVGELAKQALAEAEAASQAAAAKSATAADDLATRIQEVEAKRRQQWEDRIRQIEPRYSQAAPGTAADATKLRLVMDYAQKQAHRKQFVKALVGLDRLELLLNESK